MLRALPTLRLAAAPRKGEVNMVRFTDHTGLEWDVVLGRESWGAMVALFVPRTAADVPVRQVTLAAASYDAAVHELDSYDSAALQALLDRSTIKQEG